MISLTGKKVLFLSWPFYQYPEKIKQKLEEFGCEVFMYYSAPTNKFLAVKFLERFEFLKNNYYNSILKDIDNIEFDYLFVINSAVFSYNFLKDLCAKLNHSKKILYSWDSLLVFPKAKNTFGLFDKVFTFEKSDAISNNLNFLPLFFCDDLYNPDIVTEKYIFSFIGFGHSERYNFISKIKDYAETNNYDYFFKLYLPSKFHYIRGKYIRKIFPNASSSDFIYHPLNQDFIKEITNESRIVIDLELSNQQGLTMRTIETLGMRKKLITTNKSIVDYDFYDENNILVVDRTNPFIPNSFVESKYKDLPENIYEKYSLSEWLKVMFYE